MLYKCYCIVLGLLLVKFVSGSCKSFEGDPYAPHFIGPDFQRLYSFYPAQPNTVCGTCTLPQLTHHNRIHMTIITWMWPPITFKGVLDLVMQLFIVYSGLTLQCNMNLDTQAFYLRTSHIFGLQEVGMPIIELFILIVDLFRH